MTQDPHPHNLGMTDRDRPENEQQVNCSYHIILAYDRISYSHLALPQGAKSLPFYLLLV